MSKSKRFQSKQTRYKRSITPTIFRLPKKQQQSYDKGEIILGVLSWIYIIFMIEMGNGFSSWGGWVLVLVWGICVAIVSYFALSAKNKTLTRAEILFATVTKWIMRLFSGIMIVLLFVVLGYVLYGYFVSQTVDGKTTLIALALSIFFIFSLAHYFIYGLRHKGFANIRAEYQKRKKRYHWKW